MGAERWRKKESTVDDRQKGLNVESPLLRGSVIFMLGPNFKDDGGGVRSSTHGCVNLNFEMGPKMNDIIFTDNNRPARASVDGNGSPVASSKPSTPLLGEYLNPEVRHTESKLSGKA
eukprot:1156370-Pelagomonas_calceolata.AAC.3